MNMRTLLLVIPVSLLIAACAAQTSPDDPDRRAAGEEVPALREVFGDAFLVGAAVNDRQMQGEDEAAADLVRHHFNTVTGENVMKWENIHPEPDRYDFDGADRLVEFAEANDMFIVGHTLVWHSQTPEWVFHDEDGHPASREMLVERMRDHIHSVAGRYRGRVHGWDVVNEALNEDGSLRQTPWLQIIGEDYLSLAFQFAHEADPDAELYYNDYSLENPPKREGAVRLVRQLLDAGIPVHGIGTQGHYKMDWPSPELVDSTIVAFAELGVDVMITELDIDLLPPTDDYLGADVSRRAEMRAELDPYTDGLPQEMEQALADRYASLFRVFERHSDVITRVTFWGVSDRDSWLNGWPVRGRTSYPLLFDRDRQPKPAFHAVVDVARSDDGL